MSSSTTASSSSSSLSSHSPAEIYQRCLRRHHLELVNGVEPLDILDYLFQESLLTLRDMELIPSFPTQVDRMRNLMTIVYRRLATLDGDSAFRHFLVSLSNAYPFLEVKLRQTLTKMLEDHHFRLASVQRHDIVYERNEGRWTERVEFNTTSQRNFPDPRHQTIVLEPKDEVKDDDERFPVPVTSSDEDPVAVAAAEEVLKYPVMETGDAVQEHHSNEAHDAKSISDPEEQSQHLAATSRQPRDTSSQPRYNSSQPRDTSSQPHDNSNQPRDTSSQSHNNSSQPRDTSSQPRDTSSQPRYTVIPPSSIGAKENRGRMELSSKESSSFTNELQLLVQYSKSMVMPPSNQGKKFQSSFHRFLFDSLSSVVNAQNFETYGGIKNQLASLSEKDPDTRCLLLYLDASAFIIQSDFKNCKKTISHSLGAATDASSPNRFQVMYLSIRSWMYLKRRKNFKARLALDDALSVICQDPVTCSGMAAGWIYVDQAKLLMSMLASSKRNALSIHQKAIESMERAMGQFREDDSMDGPYGRNFASVKLASLLLGCDDGLFLVEIFQPSEGDLDRVDKLLRAVDDSLVGIASILKPLYMVALSDRKFRSGHLRRAVELAQDARDLADSKGLLEERDLADRRLDRYHRLLHEQELPRKVTFKDTLTECMMIGVSSGSDADVDEEESDDGDLTPRKPRKKKSPSSKKRPSSLQPMALHSPSFYCGAVFIVIILTVAAAAFIWVMMMLTSERTEDQGQGSLTGCDKTVS